MADEPNQYHSCMFLCHFWSCWIKVCNWFNFYVFSFNYQVRRFSCGLHTLKTIKIKYNNDMATWILFEINWTKDSCSGPCSYSTENVLTKHIQGQLCVCVFICAATVWLDIIHINPVNKNMTTFKTNYKEPHPQWQA